MRYIDEDGIPVTIYQPNEVQGGIIWGLRRAIEDIVASRHVITRLFWRDFIAQFRQKVLGYFWALLSPLLGIFSFFVSFLHWDSQSWRGRDSLPPLCHGR